MGKAHQITCTKFLIRIKCKEVIHEILDSTLQVVNTQEKKINSPENTISIAKVLTSTDSLSIELLYLTCLVYCGLRGIILKVFSGLGIRGSLSHISYFYISGIKLIVPHRYYREIVSHSVVYDFEKKTTFSREW